MRWINYRPLRRPVKHPLSIGAPLRPGHDWGGPVTSAAIHLLVILFVLGVFHRANEQEQKAEAPKEAPKRQVEMIYLPPPKVAQPPKPVVPPPEAKPTPTQQADRPAPVAAPKTNAIGRAPDQSQAPQSRDLAAEAAGKSEGKSADAGPPPKPVAPQLSPQANPLDPAPTTKDPLTSNPLAAPAKHEESQEDEARRLFGNNRNGPTGRPERAYGGMDLPWRTGDQHCVQVEPGQDTMTVIAARVYDPASGRPIAGAFLQILGTPYSAYSDGAGNYSLRFNINLVANCRTQAVRVTAAGYSLQDLTLSTGVAYNNDIPLRRN
ncbi:MAG TPA: hypothetical protein VMJ30_11015 [Gemmatimonadales bacterium]|nr:hypothetical protein [Gemmatimonadales bacterium]